MATCSICLSDIDNYQSDTKSLSCGHKYHTVCINRWLENNNTCPYCRSIPFSYRLKKYAECFIKSLYIISVLLLNLGLSGDVLQKNQDIYYFVLCILVIIAFVIIIIYNIFVTFEITLSVYLAHMLEVILILILLICIDCLIDYNNRLKNKEVYVFIYVINLLINIISALFYSGFRLILFIKKYLIVRYYIDICN